MDETLTVSQIADKFDPELYDRDRIIRQLRHWTLSGVLRPIGGTHTGIGRHRKYTPEAVFIAAILVELSRLGLSVSTLEQVTEMLYATFKDDEISVRYWREKATKSRSFLRLSFDVPEGSDRPICAVSALINPEAEMRIGCASVLIDLQSLVSRILD